MLVQHEVSKKALVTRDPDHCLDLGPKTLSKVPALAKVLDNAKEFLKFIKNDRIMEIRDKLVARGSIEACPAVNIFPDTRMYLAEDTLTSVIGQRPFALVCAGAEEYGLYHESRSTSGFNFHFPCMYNLVTLTLLLFKQRRSLHLMLHCPWAH